MDITQVLVSCKRVRTNRQKPKSSPKTSILFYSMTNCMLVQEHCMPWRANCKIVMQGGYSTLKHYWKENTLLQVHERFWARWVGEVEEMEGEERAHAAVSQDPQLVQKLKGKLFFLFFVFCCFFFLFFYCRKITVWTIRIGMCFFFHERGGHGWQFLRIKLQFWLLKTALVGVSDFQRLP